MQTKFEHQLEEFYLPDSISGNEIYIYRELMKVWFSKLIASNRYKEEISQKFRHDWLEYMQSLKDRSVYNYLSLEADDEEQSNSYRDEHIIASRNVFAIEEAFADMIGDKAVKKLKKVREMDLSLFDDQGNLK